MSNYNTSKTNANQNKEKSYNRDFIYTVPSKIFHDKDLTFNEVKVYMMIRSFMDTTGDAYPSNNWIAEEFDMHRVTVIRCINRLVEKNYIVKEDINGVRHLRINTIPLPQKIIASDDFEKNDDKSYPHLVAPTLPPSSAHATPPSSAHATQLDQTSITSKIIKRDFSKKSVDKIFKAPPERQQKEEFESCKEIGMQHIAKAKEILGTNNKNAYQGSYS